MAGTILTAANATLDNALSFVQELNQHATAELQRLRDNRARYSNLVRQVSSLPSKQAQDTARSRLTAFIHEQVALENQWQDFTAKFTNAKQLLKKFIVGVGLTPPQYLGQFEVGTVGVAVVAAALAAAAVLALISQRNAAQQKALANVADILALAASQQWTPEQTQAALDKAAAANRSSDPFGIQGVLQAALPVIVVGAAVMLIGGARRRAA